jgi:hypothetical protein
MKDEEVIGRSGEREEIDKERREEKRRRRRVLL